MASSVWTSVDDRVLSAKELREKYDKLINSDPALVESKRWIEEVTRREFRSDNFREALADGILLCELVEIVGDLSLGRINRLPTAYAGIYIDCKDDVASLIMDPSPGTNTDDTKQGQTIKKMLLDNLHQEPIMHQERSYVLGGVPITVADVDNLNLFFQACERLGLKKLHLFDVNDLQEVTTRGGASISSKAKETQRRLHNVAITILWLEKAAQNQGYQGPRLDSSCFAHLLPETQYLGKSSRERQRETRKRHSIGEELLHSRGSENLPAKKRDKVFDKVDIRDRKEKFRNLEEEKQKLEQLESTRRKSTGGILSRKSDRSWEERQERRDRRKENIDPLSGTPDLKLHEKRERYSRRQDETMSTEFGIRGSGSTDRVTSPPPISLGNKVEVDLKEKQKKFEGLDQQADEQSAVLRGRARPVSWGPGEIRQASKKQNPRDVGFKEKQKTFEEKQRQADMETAVLQGKLRPQLDNKDGKPSKVALTSKADVKLREKQKEFEKRDYQAQKESAVLQGNLRFSSTDGEGRKSQAVTVPRGAQINLGEKKAAFEQRDKQAEQDISVLRGQRRPPDLDGTDSETRDRRSRVGLPRDANISLLEKQRTFEEMDSQAKRESEILQKHSRKSFSGYVKESRPLSTSTRPEIRHFQSPSDRQLEVARRPQHDGISRPVSNYYEYSSWNDIPESDKPFRSASSDERAFEMSREEPLETAPSFEENEVKRHLYNQVDPAQTHKESEYIKRRTEESRRRRLAADDEPLVLSGDQSLSQVDARNLSYRDLVRAPKKVSRQTFIREKNTPVKVEEMPWRKEVSEVKTKMSVVSDEEQDESPRSPRSDLGKARYLELIVPPSKKAMDSFATEMQTEGREPEEMPWRKEVKEIRRSPSNEEQQAFFTSQAPPQEITRIRPPSLKTRDGFVTIKSDDNQEEMPWRKEVRELKERPRTEEEEDSLPGEAPEQEISNERSVRELSYKDFVHQPSTKRRHVFQPQIEPEKQEMPWRKEVREVKRTSTEDERNEEIQKSSVAVVHSAWSENQQPLSYNDFAAKPSKKYRAVFLPKEQKKQEEMPWRKEVRQLRERPLSYYAEEDQPYHSTDGKPSDRRSAAGLAMNYHDFVSLPSRKPGDSFGPGSKAEQEEMPWRKEVRELRERPGRYDEQIQQSPNVELESAYVETSFKGFERPSKWISETRDDILSRDDGFEQTSKEKGPDVRKLSYHDFVCPPSKISQDSQEQAKKKPKVKDLTKKFTDIEAEKNRPKSSGPPSRRSLVDKGELQRIEREMKTRSWHGYPAYEIDDDYDAEVRRRIRSQEDDDEEEMRFGQPYQQGNVSGLEQFNDVFHVPDRYFDQFQGPPPHQTKRDTGWAETEQYEVPSWKETNERKDQLGTAREPAGCSDSRPYDREVQVPLNAMAKDDYQEKKFITDDLGNTRKDSGSHVVVTQSWIQPNLVEVAETSPYPMENENERWRAKKDTKTNGHKPPVPIRSHLRDERPYTQGYQNREESLSLKKSDREDKDGGSRKPYFVEERFQRDQMLQGLDVDHTLGGEQSQMRSQREQPSRVSDKQKQAMVYGAPIVVTARPRAHQQPNRTEPVKRYGGEQFETYTDFLPSNEIPNRDGNEMKARQTERERIEFTRSLVLADIRKLGKKDAEEPKEENDVVASQPQTFAVFGVTGQRQPEQQHKRQQQEQNTHFSTETNGYMRRSRMHYFSETEQQEGSDWEQWNSEEVGRQNPGGQGYYENLVTTHTEMHPVVVSTVESQASQWAVEAFDSPENEKPKPGRMRVMNFTVDKGDDGGHIKDEIEVEHEGMLPSRTLPVRPDPYDADRKRDQRAREEQVREQLRDAEYRAKYRKEFEEKNRKQRENSKYLMSLQMRASLGTEDDEIVIDGEPDSALHSDRQLADIGDQYPYHQSGRSERNIGDGYTDERLVTVVAAEETSLHKKTERSKEEKLAEIRRHEPPRRINSDDSYPRIDGIDFVGQKERANVDGDAERHVGTRGEEECVPRDNDGRSTLKPISPVEEDIIAPSIKPAIAFAFDETLFEKFLEEDKGTMQQRFDENSNRYEPDSASSGYYDQEYSTHESLDHLNGEEPFMHERVSQQHAEVRPVNGHHYENDDYRKGQLIENMGHYYEDIFPRHPEQHPEINGFAGYNIYETFIHGESNHVICSNCGTSIEKSLSMYIAELDRYWHQDCFCCVVCRAWFCDEDSPPLHITNSMLHCERCFITDDGERCTEV